MDEIIVCPHCGGTNTSKTKTGVVFRDKDPKNTTLQKIDAMKCIDCLRKYKESGDTGKLLKYGIFNVENIDIRTGSDPRSRWANTHESEYEEE